MNQIGLHIGYWWGSGEEHDLFRMLELTHRAGLDVIELNPDWLMKLTDEECKEFTNRLADYGMGATLNGGLNAARDIASDDADARRAGVAYCREVLEKMPKLGLTVWSGCNYSEWLRAPKPEGEAQEEKARALDYCEQSMREIIRAAEDVGVDYCFEVLNRFEQFLFNTSEEAVAFAQRVGSKRAKVLLDTYHMNIEEDSSSAAIVYAGSAGRLGHIHVGTSNRRIPGLVADDLPWAAMAKALHAVDYQGALVMEPFVLTTAHNVKRIRVWRDLSGAANVDKLVSDAFIGGQFLRKLLAEQQ